MSVANAIPRKRFSRVDVEQMEEAGLFAGQRLELINGDLIDKMGQNPPHAWVIRVLQDLLISMFGYGRVQVQLPIEVQTAEREWSLPEPDIAVLAENKAEYGSRFPNGVEVLLIVEVADSSAQSDLTIKRDLYARAGVEEYWVVDLKRRCLVVHVNPRGGTYADVATVPEPGEVVIKSAGSSVSVAQLLPVLQRLV